jgi:hypothetical protein
MEEMVWTSRRAKTRLGICGLMLLLAGCYGYGAATMETVRVGQPVRARVSGAQAERLEPVLGNTGRDVEGQLIDKADSALTIAVATPVSSEGGTTLSRAYQRIEIPRADLQEIEVRHLDKTRTSLAVAAAAAGAAAAFGAVSQVIQLGSGSSRSNPNKSRVPVRLPLVLFRLSY